MALEKRFKLGLLGCVAGAASVVAGPAAAYSADLEWSAPVHCPTADALRDSVERLLGETLNDGDAVRASATVTEDGQRLALTLSIRTPEKEGTRTVHVESCQSALDVAAFGIALALNPELELEPPPVLPPRDEPVEPPPAPAPAPASSHDSAPPPAPAPVPERERNGTTAKPPPAPGRLWAAANAVIDSSLLPRPAFGLGMELEVLAWEQLRFGLGPAIFLPREERLANGGGGKFRLWSVRAHACRTLGFRLDVCPLFHFGVVRGEGRGVAPSLEQVSHVYAPGLAVRGAYPLWSGAEARAALSGLFPLGADVFVVREGEVHRIPRFSFQFQLGLAMRAF